VRARATAGERTHEAESFATGANETRLGDDEMIVEVLVSPRAGRVGSAYRETTVRHTGPPVVGCACVLRLDDERDTVTDASVWLSGLGSTPLRARGAEDQLAGADAVASVLEAAAESVARTSSPRSDARADAAYRRSAAIVICRRALVAALERARTRARAV
jgi:aerobic carbon-monoxide dehydrogenase medium subunit